MTGSTKRSAEPVTRSHSAKKLKVSGDDCPICLEDITKRNITPGHTENWVGCDKCQKWFHHDCVLAGVDIDTVETYYCDQCIRASQRTKRPLSSTFREPPRKSSRAKQTINYRNLDEGLEADPGRWYALIQTKRIEDHAFKKMQGNDLTLDWILNDPAAMTEPILFESPDGLEMKMPDSSMSISQIAHAVGPEMPVEVIDVASQNGLQNWTLGQWADYYESPSRTKVRNVISLEVTDTSLGPMISAPKVVRQLDWVQTIWPKEQRKPNKYPKVGKYCLMSVSKCWTDWHIDFAGSSVFYHILRGSKIFYFIRPTPENLRKYEVWSGSAEKQQHVWLGDEVDQVFKVELTAGNTMIIPTGWIHSVYTPDDSLVIGGNFLHSHNIATQLRIYEIELATKVPKKFRFPFFVKMLWYVGNHYHERLQESPGERPTDITPRIMDGLKALSYFMIEQASRLPKIADVSVERRKIARENVPWETVDDPTQLARDFRKIVLETVQEDESIHNLEDVLEGKALLPGRIPATAIKTKSASPALQPPIKRSAEPSLPPPSNGPKFKHFNPAAKVPSADGDIISRINRPPVTTTSFSPRHHPDSGQSQDSEIKTTTTEVQVTRRIEKDGQVTLETRTVTTVIERVSFLETQDVKMEDVKVEPDQSEVLSMLNSFMNGGVTPPQETPYVPPLPLPQSQPSISNGVDFSALAAMVANADEADLKPLNGC